MNSPDFSINPEPFRCLVIGIGGCGCSVINMMISAAYGRDTKYGEVVYIAVDSDSGTLAACKAEQKIFVPKAVLDGAEPELREQLASIPCSDMVFVVSGMGGTIGTKASPIIAEYAKQREALTIGVATLPLPAEGEQRIAAAEKGLPAFRQSTNSVIVVPLAELASGALPVFKGADIYHEADRAIIIGVTGIVDTIVRHGILGLDFADLKAILDDGGMSRIGYGSATGKVRARQAVDQAISSPTLGADGLKKAAGAILIVTGGDDISLDEVAVTADVAVESCSEDTQVIFQSFYDGKEGELSVVILACAARAEMEHTAEKLAVLSALVQKELGHG